MSEDVEVREEQRPTNYRPPREERKRMHPLLKVLIYIVVIAAIIFLTLLITVLVADDPKIETIPKLIRYIIDQVSGS